MSQRKVPEVRMARVFSSPNPIIDKPGFYDKREVLGWLPRIFGLNRSGNHVMLISALLEVEDSWLDPKPESLYQTEEEAQKAWDNASPVPIPYQLEGRCHIVPDTLNMIHELGLYRSTEVEQEQEMEIEF